MTVSQSFEKEFQDLPPGIIKLLHNGSLAFLGHGQSGVQTNFLNCKKP